MRVWLSPGSVAASAGVLAGKPAADKVAVLVYGEFIAFDTPQRVRADPRVQEAYLGAPP